MTQVDDIIKHYYGLLISEIKKISENTEMSEREKLCSILKHANNVHTLYGQNFMDYMNFADLDRSKE